MRILVTGASGFVGRSVVDRLAEEGHDLMLLSADAQPPRAGVAVTADMGDPGSYLEELRSFAPQSCVHLAWGGIPDFSAETCLRNLDDSAVFLDALSSVGTCRILVASGTCLEYGVDKGPCIETQEAAPTSYFTWSKTAVHSLARMLAVRDGLSVRWLRIFYVYGPGQRSGSLIPSLTEDFLAGRMPSVRRPSNANDFVFVDDVAEAFALAAVADAPSGAYNVGSGRSTPLHQVAAVVERAVSGADHVSCGLVSRVSEEGDVDFWADPTRSRERLGWVARTGLEDGVARYLEWRRTR